MQTFLHMQYHQSQASLHERSQDMPKVTSTHHLALATDYTHFFSSPFSKSSFTIFQLPFLFIVSNAAIASYRQICQL